MEMFNLSGWILLVINIVLLLVLTIINMVHPLSGGIALQIISYCVSFVGICMSIVLIRVKGGNNS